MKDEKDSFETHLKKNSEIVDNWPEWKKCIIGSAELSGEKPKIDEDYCQICGTTVMTTQSEPCPGCPKASK